MKDKELTVIDTPHTAVDSYRMSTDAATMCKEIVVASAQDIQGKKYVRVEGWQAIAIAHGCTASSGEVEKIEGGIRAVGKVIRMSDGMVLSQAEGFVGDDEKTWAGRPEYARRAMAQTRAISRACRSAFAHVVVMMKAGLSTIPAEEVPQEGFVEPHQGEPTAEDVTRVFEGKEEHPPKKTGKVISEAQGKRLYAIAKGSGHDDASLKALIAKHGYAHIKEIIWQDYEAICKEAAAGPEEIPF